YCHSRGDWRREVHAVAVPVKQPRGEPALAINCTVAAHRAQKDKLVRGVVPMLKDAVRQLEAAQGLH
ncbi:MAG: IclR family transcriptional regulator, partial [Ottowia sp.]|nr:IclR family transcriptional regulator [Ottowia sp.]